MMVNKGITARLKSEDQLLYQTDKCLKKFQPFVNFDSFSEFFSAGVKQYPTNNGFVRFV